MSVTKADLEEALQDQLNLINDVNKINGISDQAFEDADTDKSGELCLNEFMVPFSFVVVDKMNLPEPSQEQVQTRFNQLDSDKSGRLNKEEFRVFVRQFFEDGIKELEARIAQFQ